jgi:hypothetical protein
MSTRNHSTDDASFVSYLECSESKQRFRQDRMHGLSSAGHPLLVRYDLDAVRAAVRKEDLGVVKIHGRIAVEPEYCLRDLGSVSWGI